MNKNDEINNRIRNRMNEKDVKDAFFLCKSPNDPEMLVYDGIIAENDPPELLFLLKEANDGRDNSRKESIGFDSFVEQARKEAKEQNGKKPVHWDNLCYWTSAYKAAQGGVVYSFLDDEVQKCGGLLGEIALVNIKKVPGGSSTDPETFIHTVNNNVCAKLVRDEISWIKPKIVVCCGTYDYAREIYKECNRLPKSIPLKCGAYYFVYDGIYYLEFIHPTQYRSVAAKRCLLYAYAKEVFKDLVNQMNKDF